MPYKDSYDKRAANAERMRRAELRIIREQTLRKGQRGKLADTHMAATQS